jgi:hypothetical protein
MNIAWLGADRQSEYRRERNRSGPKQWGCDNRLSGFRLVGASSVQLMGRQFGILSYLWDIKVPSTMLSFLKP